VPRDLPLIERFDEQLTGQVSRSGTTVTSQTYCSIWRSKVAI
jgi:hypothetical protein